MRRTTSHMTGTTEGSSAAPFPRRPNPAMQWVEGGSEPPAPVTTGQARLRASGDVRASSCLVGGQASCLAQPPYLAG